MSGSADSTPARCAYCKGDLGAKVYAHGTCSPDCRWREAGHRWVEAQAASTRAKRAVAHAKAICAVPGCTRPPQEDTGRAVPPRFCRACADERRRRAKIGRVERITPTHCACGAELPAPHPHGGQPRRYCPTPCPARPRAK